MLWLLFESVAGGNGSKLNNVTKHKLAVNKVTKHKFAVNKVTKHK